VYVTGEYIDPSPSFATQIFVTHYIYYFPPVLTHPADVKMYSGTSGQVTWLVTDLTAGNTSWSVSRNGVGIANGTWTSGQAISANLDGLATGMYNFTIVVSNGYGGTASDTVTVTVYDTAATIAIVVVFVAIGAGVVLIYVLERKGVLKIGKAIKKRRNPASGREI
jgi:hypothetical protein